jgi:hypothetical protein
MPDSIVVDPDASIGAVSSSDTGTSDALIAMISRNIPIGKGDRNP